MNITCFKGCSFVSTISITRKDNLINFFLTRVIKYNVSVLGPGWAARTVYRAWRTGAAWQKVNKFTGSKRVVPSEIPPWEKVPAEQIPSYARFTLADLIGFRCNCSRRQIGTKPSDVASGPRIHSHWPNGAQCVHSCRLVRAWQARREPYNIVRLPCWYGEGVLFITTLIRVVHIRLPIGRCHEIDYPPFANCAK